MAVPLPTALARLLEAATPPEQELAWGEFVRVYSPILVHTARKVIHGRDAAMDAYAFVLEGLRDKQCARLRGYRDDGRARFTTWLVVVARRLCVDWQRARYGRIRGGSPSTSTPGERRRLQDLVVEAIDPATLAAQPDQNPDEEFLRRDLAAALGAALQRLPPRDRLLLSLRFEDDQPAVKIARVLGFPTPFHVYRHLNGVLHRIRDELRHMGIDDSTG
jgi:RNA polymerase sigma factor (sigma-70 family)